MNKITFAVKISPEVRAKLRIFCREKGLKQGFFIEKAIEDEIMKAENNEDILEFHKLKMQEKDAMDFEKFLKSKDV